jgi:uncharacterized membrane protein
MKKNKSGININRNILLGILIIVAFVMLIVTVSMYFQYERDQRRSSSDYPDFTNNTSEEIMEVLEERRLTSTKQATTPTSFMIPLFSFAGLIVGAAVYYIMSEKTEKQEKVIVKTRRAAKKNTKIILKFLTHQERKVVEKLMENKGKIRQYELSYLPDLGKVRTHRILKNLQTKGVITRERFGKVNKIALNKELYEVLKE